MNETFCPRSNNFMTNKWLTLLLARYHTLRTNYQNDWNDASDVDYRSEMTSSKIATIWIWVEILRRLMFILWLMEKPSKTTLKMRIANELIEANLWWANQMAAINANTFWCNDSRWAASSECRFETWEHTFQQYGRIVWKFQVFKDCPFSYFPIFLCMATQQPVRST